MANVRWKDKSQITLDGADRFPVTDVSDSNTDGYGLISDVQGAWELLAESTPSGASESVFSGLSTDFSRHKLIINNLVPGTSGTHAYLEVSTDNGSTWESSNYDSSSFTFILASDEGTQTSSSTLFRLNQESSTLGNGTGEAFHAEIDIYSLTQADYSYIFGLGMQKGPAQSNRRTEIRGVWESETAVDALRIYMSSGTLSSDFIRLYGLR